MTATGCDVITRFPAEELLVAGRTYVRGADLVASDAEAGSDGAPGLAEAVASSAVVEPRASRDELDTGTRELADGLPGYRLVRREDVELADALPGRSSGLTHVPSRGGTLGSTHMALTLVSLVDGHVDEHLHSFETSFYVLEGEPVLYLEGRGVKLEPGACGAIPVGAPHAFRSAERALWIEMAAPRPRIDGSDTFFLGPRAGRRGDAARRRATRATTTSSCSRTARWTSTC